MFLSSPDRTGKKPCVGKMVMATVLGLSAL